MATSTRANVRCRPSPARFNSTLALPTVNIAVKSRYQFTPETRGGFSVYEELPKLQKVKLQSELKLIVQSIALSGSVLR